MKNSWAIILKDMKMGARKLVTAFAYLCLLFSPFLLLPAATTAAVADVNCPLWDNDTPEPHKDEQE